MPLASARHSPCYSAGGRFSGQNTDGKRCKQIAAGDLCEAHDVSLPAKIVTNI